MIDIQFTFVGKCWLWQGKGAWHFITLPQDKSEEAKYFSDNHFGKRRANFDFPSQQLRCIYLTDKS